jgi:hypothetical protein
VARARARVDDAAVGVGADGADRLAGRRRAGRRHGDGGAAERAGRRDLRQLAAVGEVQRLPEVGERRDALAEAEADRVRHDRALGQVRVGDPAHDVVALAREVDVALRREREAEDAVVARRGVDLDRAVDRAGGRVPVHAPDAAAAGRALRDVEVAVVVGRVRRLAAIGVEGDLERGRRARRPGRQLALGHLDLGRAVAGRVHDEIAVRAHAAEAEQRVGDPDLAVGRDGGARRLAQAVVDGDDRRADPRRGRVRGERQHERDRRDRGSTKECVGATPPRRTILNATPHVWHGWCVARPDGA